MSTAIQEIKKPTKNGVKRLIFVGISLLLEIAFGVALFFWLTEYSTYINLGARLLAFILVLILYRQDRTSAMKMPWVMLILVFPIFGTVLYVLIGLNAHTFRMKKRYAAVNDIILPMLPDCNDVLQRMRSEDEDTAAVAAYISRNSGYPIYRNCDVTYFESGRQGLAAQLRELAKAEKFIFMEYFIIENKESWKLVEDVLIDRVRAGVEVRMFYDDLGSIGRVSLDFARDLESKGIHCRAFNPFLPGLNMFLNNRDHRKITVIDGKVGFTGGYNIANEYFGESKKYGKWKDSGVMIKGPAVNNLTGMFLEMWNAANANDHDDKNFEDFFRDYSGYSDMHRGYVVPYADDPLDDIHMGEDVYINILNRSNRYCWFITPYLILSDELLHAFKLAAMRGVDVRIITPGIPDKKTIYKVTRSFYPSLVRHGVRVYEYTPGFCHAKMCVSDDKMATCGTINLDYRSFYHHFENGCFMSSSDAVFDIKSDFERTFEECREVTVDYMGGRLAFNSLEQLILRLFAGML